MNSIRTFCLGLALSACSGAAVTPVAPTETASDSTNSETASSQGGPLSSLERNDVARIVDAGLGQFLQRLRVEPELQQGKFSGFRVVELLPAGFWQGVDLRPGDVITQVNGSSIETPNSAFEVFQSLKQAPELRVVFQRDGEQKQLILPIVGAPPSPTIEKKG